MCVGVGAMRMAGVTGCVRATAVMVAVAMPQRVRMAVGRGSRGVPVSSEPTQSHDA
jgi:hypothetical protein